VSGTRPGHGRGAYSVGLPGALRFPPMLPAQVQVDKAAEITQLYEAKSLDDLRDPRPVGNAS
jgi:hypothetical protein